METLDLSGIVTSTQVEMDEGYFILSKDFVIIARPGTPYYDWLMLHKNIRLDVSITHHINPMASPANEK